jgi:hypothetical protein
MSTSSDVPMHASSAGVAPIDATELRDSALNVSRPPPFSISLGALDPPRSREHPRREHVNSGACAAQRLPLGKMCVTVDIHTSSSRTERSPIREW